jgi:hypothetical protein
MTTYLVKLKSVDAIAEDMMRDGVWRGGFERTAESARDHQQCWIDHIINHGGRRLYALTTEEWPLYFVIEEDAREDGWSGSTERFLENCPSEYVIKK